MKRFHLSALLPKSSPAGAFVWLNVRPFYDDEVSLGWPFTFYRPYLWGIYHPSLAHVNII